MMKQDLQDRIRIAKSQRFLYQQTLTFLKPTKRSFSLLNFYRFSGLFPILLLLNLQKYIKDLYIILSNMETFFASIFPVNQQLNLYFVNDRIFIFIFEMIRKNKQSQDAESLENSSINSEDPQSKSFMVLGNQRIQNHTFPDIQLKKKEGYKKQPYCVICLRNFTNFFRQHHCRVCANAVCGDCSKSYVNKERACDLCVMQLKNPHEQKKKKQILTTLQTLCAYLIYRRNLKMGELQTLKAGSNEDNQSVLKEIQSQQKMIRQYQKQNDNLKEQKQILESELQKIREANSQIEESINNIEKEIGNDNLEQYF